MRWPRLRSLDGSTALILLWLLAAAVVALTLAIPPAFHAWGDNAYMVLAIATGLAALTATCVIERVPPTHSLLLVVGVAVILRGILLFSEPLLSTDIYRYVWDGRVQAAGINPYRYVPADAALSALRDSAIFPNINRADYAVTIYPPVAQMFFFIATRLSETGTMMKLALLACEGATVAIMVGLLRRTGRSAPRLVAYLWHPLPLWEIASSGHVDALMIALMMLGLWLSFQGRALSGAVSVALGVLAKPIGLLALPPLWRPWDWKMPVIVLGVMILCYIPYLTVGWGVIGFLSKGYLTEEQISSGDYVWPLAMWRLLVGARQGDVAIYFAVGALIFVALAFKSSFRAERSITTQLADVKIMLMVSLLVLSPNYPWYFLVLTPFVAIQGGAPVWAVTLGAIVLQEESGVGDFIPLLVRKSFLYFMVIATCAYLFFLRIASSHGESSAPREQKQQ